jgi:tetratricopeptide (TPR) repeat protein
VIDKAGKIAYIGHPMWLDFPLEGILDGTWEPEAGMKKVEEGQKLLTKTYQGGSAAERFEAWKQFETEYPMVARQSMFAPMKFNLLLETGQYAKAWETGEHLVVGAIKKDDEQMLNDIAWTIVDPESGLDEPNLPLALKAARAANKITGEGDAAILDTLARVYWLMGEKSHAIELQRKAVEHAEGAMKEGVSGTLKEYEEAIKTGG